MPQGPTRYDQVLDAAEMAFLSMGRAKVSMDEVARLAGVSRGYIYKYFRNRDGLALAVLERRAAMFNERARPFIKAQPTFADQIVEGLMLGVNLASKDPYFGSLIGAAISDSERSIAGAAESAVRYTDALWRPVLIDARAAGELKPELDLDDVVEWLNMLLLGLLTQKRTTNTPDETQRRQLRTLFVPSIVIAG